MVEKRSIRTALWTLAVTLLAGCAGPEPQTMSFDPVVVEVTFTKTEDGCYISYTPEEVVLNKHPDQGPNRAIWRWKGNGYDRAWVLFAVTDLKSCLDGHFIKDRQQGFEIVMPGGTTKTVNPADDCRTGSYDYDLRAVSDEGDECGVDPRVRIED